jgi:Anti-sigma-K factor rskA
MNATENQPCPLNEQAVGWALHALEPDEEMAVLLHVPHCPSCQAIARDADGVLSHLGAAVEQVDAPPSLRNSLMAAVAETAQDAVSTTRIPVVETPVVPPPRHRVPEPVGISSDSGRSRGSWLSRRRLVAASVALIGVLAIGGLAIRTTQLEQESQTLTARAQSVADLFQQLDRPGTKHAVLASLKTGGTTAAVVVADGQRRVFSIGLSSNATNSTYVLWGLRTGAAATPLGAFDVSSADAGVQTVGVGAQSDGYTDYAISIEPGRTLPATPTDVLAKGSVKV